MHDNKVLGIVRRDEMLLLEDTDNRFFLYYNKHNLLIPVEQNNFKKVYNVEYNNISETILLNNIAYTKRLLLKDQAIEVFSKLKQIEELNGWKISSNKWSVGYGLNKDLSRWFYNGMTDKLEKLDSDQKLNLRQTSQLQYLLVIYLTEKRVVENNRVNRNGILKLGLMISEKQLSHKKRNDNENAITNNNVNYVADGIQELLDCDKKRCGLASYEQEILYDIKAGHWDVFENSDLWKKQDERLVTRDPKLDIKKNGVIGIDFGTRSTVVVKQEGSNEIRPIRIGSLSLKAEVSEDDYENPTIISCINIDQFLNKYNEKTGRPDTSCDDLFVSYNAYHDYKNCPTENFYAYYSDLKQWANTDKKDAIVQDIRGKVTYHLNDACSIEKKYLNPIEVYAYYIGMYINNMRNGIYLKYIMSFPVKYSKSTKELIRRSFENGLRKSLPTTIVEDAELMKKFSVEYQISEPAAYAVTALEQSGFMPKDEKEKYLYGIFDFGGGTTDFDFGIWRGANDDEYDKYNCDYVLECFGADSDVQLGGENILEMLAYQVFKNNKSMAVEKKIACALPTGYTAFIGGENLINNSQSANRNLTLLKEALRPLWEQHDNWEERYCKNNNGNLEKRGDMKQKEEYIEIQMYDFNGKPVPNCHFNIDTQQLLDLIKKRIRKGVEAFFKCIEKSILENRDAQFASGKIYIFLAGNSCKSVFVKEIFQTIIEQYHKEYKRYNNEYTKIGIKEDRFVLMDPLKSVGGDEQYIPNAKTSVAYGLVKSRPGGKIYIKKNYETDSKEETRLKFYLGSERRNYFDCKLTPMIKNENGDNQTSYNVWRKFQGAGMGVARIYYTEDPCADSKIEKLPIDNIPFHEIIFEPEEDKYLFVRAVRPSTIEYAIAYSEEEIGDDVEELDIDKK